MVTLGEKLCRNDTRPRDGRRTVVSGRYGKPAAASESSVSSVAGNYPNGGLTGDIPNGTTDSLWQDWQTMEERNPFGGSGSTDTPIKQFIWGTYIDECLQINLLSVAGPQSLPAGAYYLLQDLLYRAVALTNSSGAVVESYDCDPYGNTLIFSAPNSTGNWWGDAAVQSNYGANGIIYCGYRYDAETQNYYVRNRYYSPALGRWITRDPIGYEGGINLYGYVKSSPGGNVDAAGMAAVPTTVAGMLAAPKPGRGYFKDSLKRHTNYASHLQLSFYPSDEVKKCDLCKEIKFVQFFQQTWAYKGLLYYFVHHSDQHWYLDVIPGAAKPPFYPYQTPWLASFARAPAQMDDYPGDYAIVHHYAFFQQTFLTFAVCTKGKEAGSAYGREAWQQTFHFVWALDFWANATVTRSLAGGNPPAATGKTSDPSVQVVIQ